MRSETHELGESHSPQDKSFEYLINLNGSLVENLYESKVWKEIVLPLIQEMVASVSGRFSCNRFYKGTLTRNETTMSLDKLSGYQLALEEFTNRLNDFVLEKSKLKDKKKEEEATKDAPYYNPFMESLDEEE